MDIENEYKKALETYGSERKAAKALGLSRAKFSSLLFTSQGLCPYCRKNLIEAQKSRCRACLDKADTKTPEQKAEYNKEYYWQNKEKLAAYNKAYQKNNLEKFRASRKKYDATEAGKISAARRRSNRLNYEDITLSTADLKLLKRFIKACENCGNTENLTLDHHIPLTKGGKLVLNNTNLLCNVCNSMKKDHSPEAFFSAEVLEKIKKKFEYFESFKNVSSPKEYSISKATDVPACRSFIKAHHYSQTCPGGKFYFSLEYNERLLGVAVFSNPSRQNITVEGVSKLLELSRFFIIEGTPKNTESYFLSACLRELKNSEYEGVVSYADPTEGHTGTIYKACNFELAGVTGKNYHYETKVGERLHKKQVWDRSRVFNRTEKEQADLENLIKVEELPKLKYFKSLI